MFKYLVPNVYKRILFHVHRSTVSYVVNGNWMVTEVFILYTYACFSANNRSWSIRNSK